MCSAPYRQTHAATVRKGRVCLQALALFGVALLSGRSLHAQLVVDRFDMRVTPVEGQRTTETILVTNSTATVMQANIIREDWTRSERGDNQFLPQGTTGSSCGELLTYSPKVLRLEPGKSDVVRVSVQDVPSTGRECWDAILVEQVIPHAPATRSSVNYTFRTAVKVYVVPDGLPIDAMIEDIRIEDQPGPPGTGVRTGMPNGNSQARQIAIRFHNTGGVHLSTRGHVEFRRMDNTTAVDVPIAEFPTLPGAVRKLSVDVPPDLPRGEYIVLVLLDFQGAEIAAGQIELVVN